MPQLVDPNFSRTVVLLCQHDEAGAFGLVQGSARNMLSLRDNLNAPDLGQKCITFIFDGLFSRDVQ